MALDLNDLPDDIATLKKMLSEYDSENRLLRDQVEYLKYKLFGRKSEKLTEAERKQLSLFNEAELGADGVREEASEETIVVPAHTRAKKRGRRPLPENLPRERIVYDVPEQDRHCGWGAVKSVIGEEISEKLDIEPPRLKMRQEVRLKYACRCCEGVEDEGPTVQIVPVPPAIIPKGIATASLVAFELTGKFVDAVPFYRQEKQFERLGIELSRQTLCGWAMQAAEASGANQVPHVAASKRHIGQAALGVPLPPDPSRAGGCRLPRRVPRARADRWVWGLRLPRSRVGHRPRGVLGARAPGVPRGPNGGLGQGRAGVCPEGR
jgi:transposase